MMYETAHNIRERYLVLREEITNHAVTDMLFSSDVRLRSFESIIRDQKRTTCFAKRHLLFLSRH
ncbi:hypothetical protein Hanom_Chr06g00571861 [Helianthus anomalus]